MFTDEDEWRVAIEAAKNELAMAFTQGKIDIPAPVDENLANLAYQITKRVITSQNN